MILSGVQGFGATSERLKWKGQCTAVSGWLKWPSPMVALQLLVGHKQIYLLWLLSEGQPLTLHRGTQQSSNHCTSLLKLSWPQLWGCCMWIFWSLIGKIRKLTLWEEAELLYSKQEQSAARSRDEITNAAWEREGVLPYVGFYQLQLPHNVQDWSSFFLVDGPVFLLIIVSA